MSPFSRAYPPRYRVITTAAVEHTAMNLLLATVCSKWQQWQQTGDSKRAMTSQAKRESIVPRLQLRQPHSCHTLGQGTAPALALRGPQGLVTSG